MKELRPYQEQSIESLRHGFADGHKRQVLAASTGAGKSIIAIALIRAVMEKGNRVMFLCDRRVLVGQFSNHLHAEKISHGTVMAGHSKRLYEKVQIASVQTLEKMDGWPSVDLLIVDECFVAGTKISTPRGDIDIDLVRCGDTVYNQQGIGVVQQVFSKKSSEIYILEFSDGTSIKCTGNHKFFTECGWVEAKEMAIGSYFFSIEGMRILWQTVHALDKERQEHSENNISLQREIMEYARNLLNILCKEIEEPYEQSSSKNEAESDDEREESQAYTSWRERAIIALGTACASSRSRGRMAGRTSSKDEQGTLKRGLSELLQAGYCKSGHDDRDRVRRSMSFLAREEETGSKENGSSYFPRMVNLSRIEREGDIPVFDLQISGHPSYFANGKLVHNCHAVMRKSLKAMMEALPDLKVIGLTATPYHAELPNYFTSVTNVITMGELVDQGFLVPFRVFASTEINTTGLKVTAGEWQKDALEERGLQIVGDVVADYIKIYTQVWGEPRKTICFSSGVAHGAELVKQFAEHGLNFVQISYLDDEDYKADVLREFAKPDTSIQGVISTDILTRGFDQPDVEHVIIAKPLRKSFSQHVQMVGRGARIHPGKELCIARDSLVLTDSGLVKIQDITLDNKVWDGVNFVPHQGAVCRGVKPVIHYGGVTATPEHEVMTNDGWQRLEEAARRRIGIARTGDGRHPIRLAENLFTDHAGEGGGANGGCDLQQMQQDSFRPLLQHQSAARNIGVSTLQSAQGSSSAEMDLPAMPSAAAALREPIERCIRALRDAWNSIQIFIGGRCSELGDRGIGHPIFAGLPTGQDRQRRALRTGEFALGQRGSEHEQHQSFRKSPKIFGVQGELPGSSLCGRNPETHASYGDDNSANSPALGGPVMQAEREVWDVLNAGPLQRFTVDGRLVHNCVIQDNSGNWLRFRDSFTELYHDGVKTLDSDADKRTRKEPTEKEKKQSCCPICKTIWPTLKTDICPTCGFVRERKSNVQSIAGEIGELEGFEKPEKKEKYTKEYKESFYWQLLQYARGKGYQDGWAYHKYKEKFQVYPSMKKDVQPVGIEVYSWVQSRNIAAAKRRSA